jgi:tetratricopeptide (TPR) repeat protein
VDEQVLRALRLALIALVGVASLGGCRAKPHDRAQPELPPITLPGSSPSVREQVRWAEQEARANPTDGAAAGRLGMTLHAYEQFELAATCYERAHRLSPGVFRWPYYLGRIRATQGRQAEAIAAVREALRCDPGYFPARLKLAESLLAAGRLEESRREFEECARARPDSAAAYYGLGRARGVLGQWGEAVEAYRRACAIDPKFGSAHYALALAYRRLGKTQEEREQFSAYRSSPAATPPVDDPLLAEIADLKVSADDLTRRGAELARAGRLPEAAATCERALELDPQNVVACANLITICSRQRQTDRAEQYYRQALRINPNHAASHFAYGLHMLRIGDRSHAEEAFRRTLAVDPHQADAHSNLGYLLEQRGEDPQAEKEYRAALATGPGSRAAHYNLGRLLVRHRRFEEGIAHLAKCATPDDELAPTYLYDLATACEQAGRRREALEYARRARRSAQSHAQPDLAAKAESLLKRLSAGKRP